MLLNLGCNRFLKFILNKLDEASLRFKLIVEAFFKGMIR